MPHAKVTEWIDIEKNEGGYSLLILPANANQWVAKLKKQNKDGDSITMAATNIPDGNGQVVVGFGDNRFSASDLEKSNPDNFFGFIIDRGVFRKMVKALQLVLEASEGEE